MIGETKVVHSLVKHSSSVRKPASHSRLFAVELNGYAKGAAPRPDQMIEQETMKSGKVMASWVPNYCRSLFRISCSNFDFRSQSFALQGF